MPRTISIATDSNIEKIISALPDFDACFSKDAIVHLRYAEKLIQQDINHMLSSGKNVHRLRARQCTASVEVRLSPEDMVPPVRAAIKKGLLIAVKDDGIRVHKLIGRVLEEYRIHVDKILNYARLLRWPDKELLHSPQYGFDYDCYDTPPICILENRASISESGNYQINSNLEEKAFSDFLKHRRFSWHGLCGSAGPHSRMEQRSWRFQ